MTVAPPQKKICLSDHGLSPVMTKNEIEAVIVRFKEELSEKTFYDTAVQIYHNLKCMAPESSFFYQQFFSNTGLFLTIAFRFIADNGEYEFANDYTYIKRKEWVIQTPNNYPNIK
jgi:hypothetical protein